MERGNEGSSSSGYRPSESTRWSMAKFSNVIRFVIESIDILAAPRAWSVAPHFTRDQILR